MKKVLFVLPSLPHYREDLINGIDDYLTNYNISVYAGFGSGKKYIKAATLKKSIDVKLQKIFSFNIFNTSIRWQKGLIRNIISLKPNKIIILFHLSILNYSLLYIISYLLNIKIIFWGSGSGENKNIRKIKSNKFLNFKKKIKKFFYKYSYGIITYSKSHAEFLIENSIDSKKIYPVINTLNIKKHLKIPLNYLDKKSSINFIYVGAIEKVKSIDKLIKSLSLIRSSNWKLNIIGKGSQVDNLKELICNLKLQSKVDIIGPVYDNRLLTLWKNSHICILPGVGGLVINEAMASGKIILSTTGDGCGKDILLEDRIIEFDINERSLAKKIDNILKLNIKELNSEMERNRLFANSNLLLIDMVKKFKFIIDEKKN